MEFWRFSQPDLSMQALQGSYEPMLVVLSYLVSVLASGSSMAVAPRIVATRSQASRRIWLAVGALSSGSGVWAMHFTAMLAFTLPVAVTYDPVLTGVSALPAVVGGAVSIWLMSVSRPGWGRTVLAGLVMAVGIGTMHYVGMEAMRSEAVMLYSPFLFALSIVVAWVLATAALTIYAKLRALDEDGPWWISWLGAGVAGAAVCGMHYTAMSASRFYPGEAGGVIPLPVSELLLGGAIVTLASAFILVALLGALVDRRLHDASKSLAEGAERHRAVLETMEDGFVIFDEQGGIESSNASAQRLFGVAVSDLAELSVSQLFRFGKAGPALSEADLGRVADTDRPLRDISGVRADGTVFPIDMRASRTAIGGQGLVSVIFRDITDQVAALDRTRRLAAAMDQTTDSVFVLDLDGTILYANPANERVSGFTKKDVVGTKPARSDPDGTANGGHPALWEAIERQENWSGSLVSAKKDGSTYKSEATVSPIRDEDGQVTNFVVVERDVSEQLALESQLQQAQKLESIGQLAAGIAHEINTPTQYVADNTRFLKDAFGDLLGAVIRLDQMRLEAREGPLSPTLLDEADAAVKAADVDYLLEEIPPAINQSLEGLDRVAKIVRAMKEFSHPAQEKTAIDLNQAIESTVTVATNEWKYVAELETDLDPELPMVPCLGGEMNQVVLNMVVNAAHAIGDVVGDGGDGKGTIGVSTRVDGDWVEIRISDTGSGIPESAQAKIFDPFFTTKDVGKGTGQGLSIAHSVVVQKHGGTLSFETESGVGTTFIIRLPLSPQEGEAEEAVA